MMARATPHAWMTRVARRISASSGLPLAPPKAAPCVLDLLGHARPRSRAAVRPIILTRPARQHQGGARLAPGEAEALDPHGRRQKREGEQAKGKRRVFDP